jgi:hypothetical protein
MLPLEVFLFLLTLATREGVKMKKRIILAVMLFISLSFLINLANANLINSQLGLPGIISNTTGTYVYTEENGVLVMFGTPLSITFDGINQIDMDPNDNGDQFFHANIRLDNSGIFVGGTGGEEIEIHGAVDGGNSGVLLTGRIINFGFFDVPGPIVLFDFTFTPTGGLLLPHYADQTGGCIALVEISTFAGNWNENHEGVSVVVDTAPAIEITNRPPQAICQDVTVQTETGACYASTPVDGGSYDPDGDPITFDQEPPGPYNLGPTEVTLTVTDDKGALDSCSAIVTVIDQEPPTINELSANPNQLWSPNHKMVPVTISAASADNCDLSPICQIISVTSNEPENGTGDGNTAPDWEITGDLDVNLRSERSETGVGREYTISVECVDGGGNSSFANTTVTVPINYE